MAAAPSAVPNWCWLSLGRSLWVSHWDVVHGHSVASVAVAQRAVFRAHPSVAAWARRPGPLLSLVWVQCHLVPAFQIRSPPGRSVL